MSHNPAADPIGTGLEILIADDDELLCVRLEALLAASGLRATSVCSLEMAREALRAVYFPLVILDRHLGDDDGLALCREYRARQIDRRVRILMFSSDDSADSAKMAIAAGADDFLSKRCADKEFILRAKQLYAVACGKKVATADGDLKADRVRVLSEYGILDTAPDQAYEDITRLASTICKTPIASITLLDDKRQWFKAKLGLSFDQASHEHAFCAHAITHADEVLVVPDARTDVRFESNPLVMGEPHVRFYAGAPLVTPDGHALGTICVMDRVPRNMDAEEREALRALARQVIILLEQRKIRRELEHALISQRTADADLRRSESLFREAFQNAPIGIALVSVSGQWLRVNRKISEIVGYSPEQLLRTTFQAITHPDDLETDLDHVRDMLAGVIRTYEMEKRYIHKRGHLVWVLLSVSLVLDDQSNPAYFVSQIQDITSRKNNFASLEG